MRLQDRRSDLVQQLGAPARPQPLRQRLILWRRVLARHESIDERIADLAGPGPLTMWTERGALEVGDGGRVGRLRTDGAERIGMIRGAALTGTVDEVHAIALLHVIVRPPGQTVARTHVMQHLAGAAVNEHDGILVAHARRNEVLHVHLAADDRAVRHRLVFGAYPEAALVREIHRSRFSLPGD